MPSRTAMDLHEKSQRRRSGTNGIGCIERMRIAIGKPTQLTAAAMPSRPRSLTLRSHVICSSVPTTDVCRLSTVPCTRGRHKQGAGSPFLHQTSRVNCGMNQGLNELRHTTTPTDPLIYCPL